MKAIAVAARRSALEVAGPVVVRAGVALGYAVAVFAGGALGLWLLISLISLGGPATGG
jgi:hypothetical protein